MSEIFKLCCLIVAIPYSTSSVERSFSSLKRIKTYARNAIGEDRLSNLAILSIEQERANILKSSEIFFNNIIDVFATKNRRIDLMYK